MDSAGKTEGYCESNNVPDGDPSRSRDGGGSSYDGPRAWSVCAAGFVVSVLIVSCSQTYGTIFPVLLDEFKQGKAKTAWVGSLAIALSMTFSPVAAKLIDRFGYRLVSLAGGVFAALGLFITSQVNTIAMMYLTYSVIFGFGSSCVFTPAYTVVPGHFTKWQSTAMGLMGSSNGLSLAMSMLIKTLLSNYGWRVTFMAMGGFALADAVIGGIFFVSNTREHKSQPSKDQVPINSSGDVPLWKNKHILVCAFASFLFQFGNTIPLVHLVRNFI
ncbi:predicted protein [Nematostella vectensis]|uniref:Major facilitator superfamily (MFS) profile domain-containing protein n=1 Tax=Nematostella vectensis TaxID=45351 RepID=A7S0F8_NEMVE|nr:predicted protein [Nematostella vectensis]|eukprot:XP_001634929.1 predicted protein [Nematostella vectensis]